MTARCVPIGRAVGDVGIVWLDVHPAGWDVRIHRAGGPLDEPPELSSAEDDRGTSYRPCGGGGGGGDRWFDSHWMFRPGLGAGAQTLRLCGDGPRPFSIEVPLPRAPETAAAPWSASLRRGRPQETRAGGTEPAPEIDEARGALRAAVLPDEIELLGASVVLGTTTVTFLALERWGSLVRLRHHWADPAVQQWPLLRVLEVCVDDRAPAPAVPGGGGTSIDGSVGDLVSTVLPEALSLRTPLGEIELRRGVGR